MSKVQPIFRSFAAGELSPRMYSRTDASAWASGLAKLENAICASLGPVIRRFGTRYAGNSVGATKAKVIGFDVDVSTAYSICITDKPEIVLINLSDPAVPVVEQRIAATPWTASQIPLIQYDSPPENQAIFIVSPEVAPYELVYDGTQSAGSRWSLAIISFTSKPGDWTGTNWPSAIAFFEGRSYFASTDTLQQTFWASVSASYKDFTTGATASSSLEFTLARRGRIEWLAATKNLLVGTSNGEHIVTSEAGVVTVNDIQVSQQSSYGCLNHQALLIGNVVVYISPDGRKVRDVGYKWEENSWQSRDVTFLSEHITDDGDSLKDIAWAQHPENIMWCVTDLGNLVGCTYERTYDVIGWHKHTTQGTILSVGSADVNGSSIPVHAVIRDSAQVVFEVEDKNNYMDSNLEVVPTGALGISLPHLPNAKIQVTVGGAVHPEVQLDGSGDGTLNYTTDPARPGDVVVAGLGYTSRIETLPLDYLGYGRVGTSAHFMKRWNKIYVRVLKSAKPSIGKVGDVERPPTRTPSTPMNLPQPVISDDVKVLNQGWDRFSQVFIEQDLPLPLTITGIFGELTQYVDED